MQNRERGVALVLVLVVLVIISTVVAALVTDVVRDHFITRNLRLQREAQNWSESGLDLAEAVLDLSYDGELAAGWSQTLSYANATTVVVSNSGGTDLPLGNGTASGELQVRKDGTLRSTISVRYLGAKYSDGNSVIIAAGYQPLGLSGQNPVSIQHLYELQSNGTSTSGSLQRAAEIYAVEWQ